MNRRTRVLVGALVLVLLSGLAVPAAPGAVADPRPGAEVVGGQPADPGEDPWMAALVLDERITPSPFAGLVCGASFLSPDTVVTAAHCVEPGSARILDVVVGSRDLLPAAVERIPVRNISIHPRNDPRTGLWDVAVVQLVRPASVPVTPIDLPAPGEETLWAPGTTLRFTGWGADALGVPISRLQEGEGLVVADADCRAAYTGAVFRGTSMLCVGDPTGAVSPCFGDSGGPLTVLDGGRPILVGLVLGGFRCGDPNYPAIFTEVLGARTFLEPFLDPDDPPGPVRGLRAARRGPAADAVVAWWRPPTFDGGARIGRVTVTLQPGGRTVDLRGDATQVRFDRVPTGQPLRITVTPRNPLGPGPTRVATVR